MGNDLLFQPEFARCVFNESSDAFLIADPNDLRVIEANATAQRLTGWRRKRLLEMKIDELIEGADQQAARAFLQACRDTGFFHAHEGYVLQRNQPPGLPVNISISRLHGDGKSAPLALVSARDISARKQAEDALRESNQRLQAAHDELKRSQDLLVQQERMRAFGQLASGITHDLQNLLTPITSLAGLAASQSELPANVREWLRSILTASRDATQIVDQLQMLHHDKQDRPARPIGLAELLRQVPDLTLPIWSGDQHRTIEIDLDVNDVPAVLADPSQIRRVLMNLVGNAVEAMPAGGRVGLRLWADAGNVLIEVSDTGVGMTDEQRRKCCDPFYTTKDQGLGLGLSVAREIVQSHHGVMEINGAADRGTAIRLQFPAAGTVCGVFPVDDSRSQDLQNSDHPSQIPHDPQPLSNLRVLYVDDNQLARDSVKALMASWGIHLELAINGAEGIAEFENGTYDAVMTDLRMDGMDGRGLTWRIKQLNPQTPVIVVSGWNQSLVWKEFRGGVSPDYVVYKADLSDCLRDALKKVQAARQSC